jgi:hypothetical protein
MALLLLIDRTSLAAKRTLTSLLDQRVESHVTVVGEYRALVSPLL